jgi:hypothetical protein
MCRWVSYKNKIFLNKSFYIFKVTEERSRIRSRVKSEEWLSREGSVALSCERWVARLVARPLTTPKKKHRKLFNSQVFYVLFYFESFKKPK